MAATTALRRPRDGRWIGGVCAGLARRFAMKPWQVRLLFVLSCLLPGPQILIYIALWIILPAEEPRSAEELGRRSLQRRGGRTAALVAKPVELVELQEAGADVGGLDHEVGVAPRGRGGVGAAEREGPHERLAQAQRLIAGLDGPHARGDVHGDERALLRRSDGADGEVVEHAAIDEEATAAC